MSTPEALREHADPLHGLRPEGSVSRLWAQSDDEDISTSPSFCKLDVSALGPSGIGVEEGSCVVQTPSTGFLLRSVHAAGFSTQDVDAADKLLHCPAVKAKILAPSTPVSMGTATRAARSLVSSMVDLSKGAWKGPLPAPRISPPMSIRDCPIKDLRSCSGDRRIRVVEKKRNIHISKTDPRQLPQSGEVIGLNFSVLQRARGRGRDRGRGASLYGRGGGRYNQRLGNAPAAGPVKLDVSSSSDRQFESATSSLEIMEQCKAAQVLPQFQLEVQTTGEKRKDPQD
jgi:hypothetical protein